MTFLSEGIEPEDILSNTLCFSILDIFLCGAYSHFSDSGDSVAAVSVYMYATEITSQSTGLGKWFAIGGCDVDNIFHPVLYIWDKRDGLASSPR